MKKNHKKFITTDAVIFYQIERMLDCFYKSQEFTSPKSLKYNSFRLYRCHCIAEKIKSVIEKGVCYSRRELSAIYGAGHAELKSAVSSGVIRAYEKALEKMSCPERDFKKHSIDMDSIWSDTEEGLPF